MCDDDARAEEFARRLMEQMRHVDAIEAWVRPRLVCRLNRGDPNGKS